MVCVECVCVCMHVHVYESMCVLHHILTCDAVGLGEEDGRSDNEIQVDNLLIRVEFNHFGTSFWTRPEWLTSRGCLK